MLHTLRQNISVSHLCISFCMHALSTILISYSIEIAKATVKLICSPFYAIFKIQSMQHDFGGTVLCIGVWQEPHSMFSIHIVFRLRIFSNKSMRFLILISHSNILTPSLFIWRGRCYCCHHHYCCYSFTNTHTQTSLLHSIIKTIAVTNNNSTMCQL